LGDGSRLLQLTALFLMAVRNLFCMQLHWANRYTGNWVFWIAEIMEFFGCWGKNKTIICFPATFLYVRQLSISIAVFNNVKKN
jgi:hypothetical protein